MAGSQITFYRTGRPMRPRTNPRLNREASKRSVQQTAVKSQAQFQDVIQKKLEISPNDLSKYAKDIPRKMGGGIDLNI